MSSRRSADALARTFAALLLAGIGTSVTSGGASAASSSRPARAELEVAAELASQPGQEASRFDGVWGNDGDEHAAPAPVIGWRTDLVGHAVVSTAAAHTPAPTGSVLDLAPKTSPPNQRA